MSSGGEEEVKKDELPQEAATGAAAAAASPEACPQPPYDEDFNPFSEEGIYAGSKCSEIHSYRK